MTNERAPIQVTAELKKKLKLAATKAETSIGKFVQFLFDEFKKKNRI